MHVQASIIKTFCTEVERRLCEFGDNCWGSALDLRRRRRQHVGAVNFLYRQNVSIRLPAARRESSATSSRRKASACRATARNNDHGTQAQGKRAIVTGATWHRACHCRHWRRKASISGSAPARDAVREPLLPYGDRGRACGRAVDVADGDATRRWVREVCGTSAASTSLSPMRAR